MVQVEASGLSTENSLAYFKRQGRPIVALATAAGGPVAVLRVSGRGLTFLETLTGGALPAPGTFSHRRFSDSSGQFIDHGLVLSFQSPHSFTGEDVVEFHVHGVGATLEQMQNAILKAGAELALPGEFSFRSVMNQKMNLAEAEALNAALSLPGLGASGAQRLLAFGNESKEVEAKFAALLSTLNSARARVEAAIDFPEAEAEQARDIESALKFVREARASAATMISAYENFCAAADEVRVVILGAPNVGKSTLLNLLAGATKALVSEQAGTTRDVVEARVRTPAGRWVRVMDTAGLREVSSATLERQGMNLGINAATRARLLVLIARAGEKVAPEACALAEKLGCPVLHLHSHADALSGKAPADTYDFRADGQRLVSELLTRIDAELSALATHAAGDIPLSRRQAELLRKSEEALAASAEALTGKRPMELAGEDLRAAEEHVQRALGQGLTENYIAGIFSQFCLGK